MHGGGGDRDRVCGAVWGLGGCGCSCSGDHSVPTDPGAASSSATDAGGGAAAGADGVEGVLAALRRALAHILRQAGRLGAAVV